MSSSENLQPENADDEDTVEDTSIPTLSNRSRLLVVPKELQVPVFSKTYRTRTSGRILGKLKGFMDLPMDVVFEAAMYLAPNDLLQLSRLSKQFRSIFASRSSIFVWQTVFRNADLKCFKGLNEIQFASLLYDKCCMACRRITRACQLFPVLRLRLCPSCQTTNLVTKSDLLIQYPNAGKLIDNLPAWLAWRTRKCFKPEAHLLIEKFLSLKKGRSRDILIANMMEHTRARHEETQYDKNQDLKCPWSSGEVDLNQVHVETVNISQHPEEIVNKGVRLCQLGGNCPVIQKVGMRERIELVLGVGEVIDSACVILIILLSE